jgi:hypothetical protein
MRKDLNRVHYSAQGEEDAGWKLHGPDRERENQTIFNAQESMAPGCTSRIDPSDGQEWSNRRGGSGRNLERIGHAASNSALNF